MLKERVLLVSVLSRKDEKTDKAGTANLMMLRESRLQFEVDLHQNLFRYVCKVYDEHQTLVTVELALNHFAEDADMLEEIEKIRHEYPLYAGNYAAHLAECRVEEQKRKFVELLKEASEISETGKKLRVNWDYGKDFLKGPEDAVRYLAQYSQKIVEDIEKEAHTSMKDNRGWFEYLDAKRRQDKLLKTGFDEIDHVTRGGIPEKSLWFVLAATGHLKSTICINMAYSNAVRCKADVKYITLEMDNREIQSKLYALHSANTDIWSNDPLFQASGPLPYIDIFDGTLNSTQEEFLKKVIDDFSRNETYGNIHIYKPIERFGIAELRTWAQVEYQNKAKFDAIYIDHIELLSLPPSKDDHSVRLAAMLKELRQFTLNFNKGKGMRVIGAYQANRTGKEAAKKNEGVYDTSAMSWSSEAERCATMIVSCFFEGELAEHNLAKISWMKNRRGKKEGAFIADVQAEHSKVFVDKNRVDSGLLYLPRKPKAKVVTEPDDKILMEIQNELP